MWDNDPSMTSEAVPSIHPDISFDTTSREDQAEDQLNGNADRADVNEGATRKQYSDANLAVGQYDEVANPVCEGPRASTTPSRRPWPALCADQALHDGLHPRYRTVSFFPALRADLEKVLRLSSTNQQLPWPQTPEEMDAYETLQDGENYGLNATLKCTSFSDKEFRELELQLAVAKVIKWRDIYDSMVKTSRGDTSTAREERAFHEYILAIAALDQVGHRPVRLYDTITGGWLWPQEWHVVEARMNECFSEHAKTQR